MEEETCYYCGMHAGTTDHVIPRVVLRHTEPEIRHLYEKHRILTVPCCFECNSLLGSSFQRTLEGRKHELKKRLKRKYKKLLAMPDWTIGEINEMGDSLRQYIYASELKKEQVRKRLQW